MATSLGGVPYYTFSKDGGITYQSANVFYNLSPATYQVVVKDSKGCTSVPIDVVIKAGTASCVTGRIAGKVVDASGSRINTPEESNNSKLLDSPLDLQVYPNPFASEFTLNVQGNNTDKISLIVTDVLGRRWYQAEGNANQQYKLGSNLRSGIYIVQVVQADKVQTIKIIKE